MSTLYISFYICMTNPLLNDIWPGKRELIATAAGSRPACQGGEKNWLCAYKGMFFQDWMEPIFGRILGHKFLVTNPWSVFMSHFHARQFILPGTRRGHVIFLGKFLQTPRVDHIAIGLSKQTASNLAQNMAFKGAYFILLLEKKGWSKAYRWGGAIFVLARSLFEFVGSRLEKGKFRFRCYSTWMS